MGAITAVVLAFSAPAARADVLVDFGVVPATGSGPLAPGDPVVYSIQTTGTAAAEFVVDVDGVFVAAGWAEPEVTTGQFHVPDMGAFPRSLTVGVVLGGTESRAVALAYAPPAAVAEEAPSPPAEEPAPAAPAAAAPEPAPPAAAPALPGAAPAGDVRGRRGRERAPRTGARARRDSEAVRDRERRRTGRRDARPGPRSQARDRSAGPRTATGGSLGPPPARPARGRGRRAGAREALARGTGRERARQADGRERGPSEARAGGAGRERAPREARARRAERERGPRERAPERRIAGVAAKPAPPAAGGPAWPLVIPSLLAAAVAGAAAARVRSRSRRRPRARTRTAQDEARVPAGSGRR